MFAYEQFEATMPRTSGVPILRRLGWLAETDEHFRERLLARCDVLSFCPGESIYRAGRDGGGLFGVAAGKIALSLPAAHAGPELGYVRGPGFWMGDIAAVTGGPRLIDARAVSKSVLFRLPRAEVLRLTQEDPAGWRHIAILTARNLAMAIGIIAVLRHGDPAKRVAALLLGLAEGADVAIVRCSQAELGAMAVVGRTSLSAILASLEKCGWIRRRYGAVEIVDRSALGRAITREA